MKNILTPAERLIVKAKNHYDAVTRTIEEIALAMT